MSEKLYKMIECPDCGGSGTLVNDFYDPSNHHGHGQTEQRCITCDKTGEIEVEVDDEE